MRLLYKSITLSVGLEKLKNNILKSLFFLIIFLSCAIFTTRTAPADELKQVIIYSEAGLPGEGLLHLPQAKPGEINNHATVGANQVVMMPQGTNCIATAAIPSVQLTDKP